jgi:tungstate transport system substrate-binding protein
MLADLISIVAPVNRALGAARRWLAALACALAIPACASPAVEPLALATTTSVGNSGLLDALLPAFQRQHGYGGRAHLAGSGLSLKMLEDGDVDLVISHAPAAERQALASHPTWHYRKVMFNDFVLVGPPTDPAGVRQAHEVGVAMQRIAASAARFLSRGDLSGTHEREEALWQAAGARPPRDRLIIAGAAMGATLRIASETESYTMSDRATFLRLADSLRLVIVFEGGAGLLNTYSVLVDPDGRRAADARRFADWLADGEGRRVVENYRVDGRQVFFAWPNDRPADTPSALPR